MVGQLFFFVSIIYHIVKLKKKNDKYFIDRNWIYTIIIFIVISPKKKKNHFFYYVTKPTIISYD